MLDTQMIAIREMYRTFVYVCVCVSSLMHLIRLNGDFSCLCFFHFSFSLCLYNTFNREISSKYLANFPFHDAIKNALSQNV